MRNVFLLVLIATLFTSISFAQGVSYNTTGSPAAASAMLDVASTTQGILVPRMTTTQRTGISSPANGLLVYQTDGTSGFYYYNGSAWTSLSGGGGGATGPAGGNLTGTYPNPTIASGVITTAMIGATGTPSSSTFLRGDGTWGTPIAGTIGGTISVNTLALTTSTQSYNYSSSPGVRAIIIDQTNSVYWTTNVPNVSVALAPASSYSPGTVVHLTTINNNGYNPSVTFTSSGSTFKVYDHGLSGPSYICAWGIINLISDGVNTWYTGY